MLIRDETLISMWIPKGAALIRGWRLSEARRLLEEMQYTFHKNDFPLFIYLFIYSFIYSFIFDDFTYLFFNCLFIYLFKFTFPWSQETKQL